MTDDLMMILASVFKMGKGSSLSKMEIRNLLVYNLRWFDPEEADKVVQAAFSSGYVQSDREGDIQPVFNLDSVDLDVDYSPPEDLDLSRMVRPLFERLIESLMKTGLEKKEAVRLINRKVEEMNLLFSCAAIFSGIERGVDMSRFYAEVENTIRFGER